jgi:hypothetical protein
MSLRHSMRQKVAKRSQKLWRVVRYNAWDVGDRVLLGGLPGLDRACIRSAENPMISQARRSGVPKTPRFVGFRAIWKPV